jgi:hypothetical protein
VALAGTNVHGFGMVSESPIDGVRRDIQNGSDFLNGEKLFELVGHRNSPQKSPSSLGIVWVLFLCFLSWAWTMAVQSFDAAGIAKDAESFGGRIFWRENIPRAYYVLRNRIRIRKRCTAFLPHEQVIRVLTFTKLPDTSTPAASTNLSLSSTWPNTC